MRSKLVGLFAAAALISTGPVVAQSRAAEANVPARSGAAVDDANQLRGGIGIHPLEIVATLGLIVWILALTDTWPFDDDEEDFPVSP